MYYYGEKILWVTVRTHQNFCRFIPGIRRRKWNRASQSDTQICTQMPGCAFPASLSKEPHLWRQTWQPIGFLFHKPNSNSRVSSEDSFLPKFSQPSCVQLSNSYKLETLSASINCTPTVNGSTNSNKLWHHARVWDTSTFVRPQSYVPRRVDTVLAPLLFKQRIEASM